MTEAFDCAIFIDDANGSVASLATQFGFKKHPTQFAIDCYVAGEAVWLVHQARNEAEANLLTKRGPSPYMIAMKTNDAAVPHPFTLLGLPAPQSPYCYALDPHILFCQTPPKWRKFEAGDSDIQYTAIDHFAIACPKQSVSDYVTNLIQQYNFHLTYELNVADGDSGMQSVALANHNNNIRLPIIGPDGNSSQVQTFITESNGPGIQHLGLATDNIIETVRALKSRGVEFLKIKDEYYKNEAFKAMPISDEAKEACRKLNILADKDEQGNYLLQIFTAPCLGSMMIEIIERHNHQTFGQRNIQSLFETVADYQKKQLK